MATAIKALKFNKLFKSKSLIYQKNYLNLSNTNINSYNNTLNLNFNKTFEVKSKSFYCSKTNFENQPSFLESNFNLKPTFTQVQLSDLAFPETALSKFNAPLNEQDIEIKPDGLIYLPEIKYRRILNSALGAGAWVLIPCSPPQLSEGCVTREFALFIYGKFVSQSIGEQQLNPQMSSATASEGAKSKALMRCCKDIGVGSELWDPNFINRWKSKYAEAIWCEHYKTKEKKKLWKRKDRLLSEYPWKELPSNNHSKQQTSDLP
eukprot:TRINITY_DN8481_c0_g1_i1.p1 TRINITY_DN8481_c0_g1~~TRINITY_DN8481_c0_g1_i1.p1  ORF type:complete len:263 (-),score=106.26 TRINITY_DN8481_c0_g1_i1:55-843(-)